MGGQKGGRGRLLLRFSPHAPSTPPSRLSRLPPQGQGYPLGACKQHCQRGPAHQRPCKRFVPATGFWGGWVGGGPGHVCAAAVAIVAVVAAAGNGCGAQYRETLKRGVRAAPSGAGSGGRARVGRGARERGLSPVGAVCITWPACVLLCAQHTAHHNSGWGWNLAALQQRPAARHPPTIGSTRGALPLPLSLRTNGRWSALSYTACVRLCLVRRACACRRPPALARRAPRAGSVLGGRGGGGGAHSERHSASRRAAAAASRTTEEEEEEGVRQRRAAARRACSLRAALLIRVTVGNLPCGCAPRARGAARPPRQLAVLSSPLSCAMVMVKERLWPVGESGWWGGARGNAARLAKGEGEE